MAARHIVAFLASQGQPRTCYESPDPNVGTSRPDAGGRVSLDSHPLVPAASGAVEELRRDDAWSAVELLYVGAVLELMKFSGGVEGRLPSPRCDLENPNARLRLTSTHVLRTLHEWTDRVRACPLEQRITQLPALARALIEGLGIHLLRRLGYRLLQGGTAPSTPPRFLVNIGDRSYSLVPSALAQGDDAIAEDSLRERLLVNSPTDGWSDIPPKVHPPFVRVLDADGREPLVSYLELLNPVANTQLAATRHNGLCLAAGSFLPNLNFPLPKPPLPLPNNRFRLTEPASYPTGWETELATQLDTCIRKKVSLLVLPELICTPAIERTIWNHFQAHRATHPVLYAPGSWHTTKDGVCYNRLPVYSRQCSMHDPLLHHDKFERFADNGLIEDIQLGTGLTFLVTSVGLLAFGICKDWYVLRSSGEPKALTQLLQALPVIAICPAMTGNTEDMSSLLQSFKSTRTAMVFANACGMSKMLTGRACCTGHASNSAKDLRSFIAAPSDWFTLYDGNESSEEPTRHVVGGVPAVFAPCRGARDPDGTRDNMAVARLVPTD